MSLTIRPYRPEDAEAVGILVADTYTVFNLQFVPPEKQNLFLGPFQHARSDDPELRAEIAKAIEAPYVFVAEKDGEIVGVLRGSVGRIHSLFVRWDHHRRGIGTGLVERFEEACRRAGADKITLAATLYAVPFYSRVGYKRSTGLRTMCSFEGEGMPYQPMKKVLDP